MSGFKKIRDWLFRERKDFLLLFLFSIPLTIFMPTSWMYIVGIYLLFLFFPGGGFYLSILGSLAGLFFFSEMYWGYALEFFPQIESKRILASLGAVVLLVLYAFLVKRLCFFRKNPLSGFLFILGISLFLANGAKIEEELMVAYLIVVARIMWSAVLILSRWDINKNILHALSRINPFWWDGRLPFLTNNTQRVKDIRKNCRKKLP